MAQPDASRGLGPGGLRPAPARRWLVRPGPAAVAVAGVLSVWLVVPGAPPSTPLDVGPAAVTADPVIAAAGDIACDPASSSFRDGAGTSTTCRQRATSDLLVGAGLEAVLLLGDNQYYCGSLEAYQRSYDPSWGRVKSITRPSVGNHEYLTSGGTGCTSANAGAAGHFDYFGTAAGARGQGYYSFDVGRWHIIALNSNCSDAGGCGPSSPQGRWLAADLAASTAACTAAFWHIPRFSSGGRAASNSQAFWDALYAADADVVLAGHDHIYERFAPQNPQGQADPLRGIRQFTVGTGGANHTSLVAVAANSQVRNADTYGVLKLTLRPTGYSWNFVPEVGGSFSDSGSAACHGPGTTTDTTAPTAPTGLSASAPASDRVDLSWTASTDNVGVAGYRVRRDGVVVATVGGTAHSDTSVAAATTYSYSVEAFDAAGNTSAPSAPRSVTTPAGGTGLVFRPVADAYVQSDRPTTNYGSAAELVNDASPVRRTLVDFAVTGVGGRRVTRAVMRLYTTNGSAVGGEVHRLAGTWNEGTVNWGNAPAFDPAVVGSIGPVAAGAWHEVDVTPLVAGDGTVRLGMLSTSNDGAYYSSREGANPPQLVVTASDDQPPPPPPPGSVTLTSGPTDDTYVQANRPSSNYGGAATVVADAEPERRALFRFDVSGVGARPVTSATLRIYCTNGSPAGGTVYGLTSTAWGEATARWQDAPGLGPPLREVGAVAAGRWYEVDVTARVAGDGPVGFGLASTSSDGAYYSSKEGSFPPQLVVTAG